MAQDLSFAVLTSLPSFFRLFFPSLPLHRSLPPLFRPKPNTTPPPPLADTGPTPFSKPFPSYLVNFANCLHLKVKRVKEMAEGDEDLPRDAKIVKSLLKSMGVEDYEPRVIHQFLELWYRYVVDVLTDAQVYSEHAGKAAIDTGDVKLAIQSKVNFSFSQPPPREVLLELARNRNKIPLPGTIAGAGIPLPPEQDTLISPNYQLAIPKKQPSPTVEETEEDEELVDPNPSQEQRTDMPQHTQRVSFPLMNRPK